MPVNLWLLMKMIASQLLPRFILLALVNGIITICVKLVEILSWMYIRLHICTFLIVDYTTVQHFPVKSGICKHC